MTKLRALLIDDEAPARRIVREYLADFPQIDVIGEVEDGERAVASICELEPDMIFLDIQMPVVNGFEVLARVQQSGIPLPAVIFSTAFDEFALKAFDVNAVDYLLKPYDRSRFRTAVDRILQREPATGELRRLAQLLAYTAAPGSGSHPDFLMVRHGQKVVPIRSRDVEWIEAADNYAILHVEENSYVASSGLGEIEKRLDPSIFLRVHRSAIINVTLVRHLEPDGSGGMVATMQSGALVKVSRSYAPMLRKLLI